MCEKEVREKPNSVEIAYNAKGELSYKVKCYADDGADAFIEVNQIIAKIEKNIPTKMKR